MQSMTKRLLSLVVAMFMVLAMLPTGTLQASAEEGTTQTPENTTPDVEQGGTEEPEVPAEPALPEGWSVSYHCVCGDPASTQGPCAEAGHTLVEWKPWTKTNVSPFLGGYWYLENDLDLTGVTDYRYHDSFATATAVIGRKETVSASADSLVGSAVHVYLDLNGKTITGKSDHRIFRLENDAAHSLTICDTAGGGKILPKSAATNTNHGMGIWARGANHITIYGGTLDASGATVIPAANASTTADMYTKGGNVAIENGNAVMDIYGGTFIGGTLNIHGGMILGGTIKDIATAQGANIRSQKALNIYGGTIEGGTVTGTVNNCQGGNVSNTGATFYMSGGTITGGTATDTDGGTGGCLFTTTGGIVEGGTIQDGRATRSATTGTGYLGGCVYVYSGNFQLKGGTIQATRTAIAAYRGGAVYVRSASTAQFTMTGGTVVAGNINDFGGAIGTEGVGTINIGGGTVTAAFYADGTSITDPADAMIEGATRISCAGACIGTWNGNVNITGGTIIAGNAGGAGGGAVSVHGGTKLIMSGGQIVGGTGTGTNKLYGGTAISVYSSGSKFTMTGGSITGGKGWRGAVHVRNGGAIEVSGNAVIFGNKDQNGAQCNVLLGNVAASGTTATQTQLTIGAAGLGENAKIGVSMDTPGVFTTNAAAATKIIPDSGYYLSENEDGTLSQTTHAVRTHCICGGTYDHEHANLEGEWKPWDGKSGIAESGNYYLTQSLTGSTQYWMGGTASGPAEPITINLCLNGHSIDSNYRVFGIAPNVTFNLTNCHEVQSVLAGCCASSDQGRVIAVNALTATMNMYGNVKLLGKEMAGRLVPYGGVLKVNGKFTMYGGEIVGGYVGGLQATTKDNETTYQVFDGRGGVAIITAGAEFNLYGGTVYGGNGGLNDVNEVTDGAAGKYKARSLGGAFYLDANAALTIAGGTVYGGHVADGGVAYAKGNKCRVLITDGTIYTGKAAFGGGAFKVEIGANLTMTGGVIDGKNPLRNDSFHAGGAGGGAIMLWEATATVAGDAIIRNCYTSGQGGAIRVTSNSVLTLGGDVQITGNGVGTAKKFAPNDVFLLAGLQLKLDGLTTDANVGIDMAVPGVFAVDGAEEALLQVFTPTNENLSLGYSEEGLYLSAPFTVDGTPSADLAAAKDGSLVTLNENMETDLKIAASLYLDLNGKTLTGSITVAEGKTLYLMDTVTADYDASDRGMILGGIFGDVATSFNTPEAYGHNYKYLVLQEEASAWSAHRIYLSVKSVTLSPDVTDGYGNRETAIRYNTVFKCSDFLAEYVTSYGVMAEGDDKYEYSYEFGVEGGMNEGTMQLEGTMNSCISAEDNAVSAGKTPAVSAYVRLYNGWTTESAAVTMSLKDLILAVNERTDLTDLQKDNLGIMYVTFREVFDSWTDADLANIKAWAEPWKRSEPVEEDYWEE